MARRVPSPLILVASHLSRLISLSLFLCSITKSQGVRPDPTFDCTNSNLQVVYTACTPNDYSKCCAVGTSCCAGGCCDLLSNCLNVGTKNEICCPATDETLCGSDLSSGGTPPYAVQNVVCTGVGGLSSYYCPPGSKCSYDGVGCVGGSSTNGTGSSTNSDGTSGGSSNSEGSSNESGEPSPTSSQPRLTVSSATPAVAAEDSSSVGEVSSSGQPDVTAEPSESESAVPSVVTVDASPSSGTPLPTQSTVTASEDIPSQRTITRAASDTAGQDAQATGDVTITVDGAATASGSTQETQQPDAAAHLAVGGATHMGFWMALWLHFFV